MNQRGALIPLAGLVLSMLAAGCQTTPPLDPSPQMRGTRLSIDDDRADRVLRAYLALADTRSALRGSARVRVEGPDFKLNRPQRILLERPARLRFEVIGLFDQLAAILATDGRRFGFYDAARGGIARGRVTPPLLWELAKIDLEVHEVVGLLLAAPIPSRGISRSSVWLEPDGRIAVVFAWPEDEPETLCHESEYLGLFEARCFMLVDSLADGGEIYVFDVEGRLVEVRDLEPGGAIRFRATFEGYRSHAAEGGEVDFPDRITVQSPRASSLARFDWKRVMFSNAVADRFFTLPETNASNPDG